MVSKPRPSSFVNLLFAARNSSLSRNSLLTALNRVANPRRPQRAIGVPLSTVECAVDEQMLHGPRRERATRSLSPRAV